jgi:hypothetical protein
MFLVQLLLPTRDNEQRPIDGALFGKVRTALADRFGGVTAYHRSPASGLWKRPDGAVDGDEVVMVEVEAQTLDREWFAGFRRQLERDFKQESILVRAIAVENL